MLRPGLGDGADKRNNKTISGEGGAKGVTSNVEAHRNSIGEEADIKEGEKCSDGREVVCGHGKGEGPLLGTQFHGIVTDRAAVSAETARWERVVFTGDWVVECGLPEEGTSGHRMVAERCTHPAPVSEHMSEKRGDRHRELAEVQRGGEKELALVKVAVGVVKVFPN